MRPTSFALGALLLAACNKTPGAAGLPGSNHSDPTTPLIGCRTGDFKAPDRTVPARTVMLSLSLDGFGPFPDASGTVATWASPSASVASQCKPMGTSDPSPRVGFYRGGGFVQTFCTYEIGAKHVTNDAELAAALMPIDSPRKALAMVALSKVLAYEPDVSVKAPTKEVKMPIAVAEKGVPPAFEVETHSDGYLVRAPVLITCPVMVVRTAFRVTRAGKVCEADEAPVLLDEASGVCAD